MAKINNSHNRRLAIRYAEQKLSSKQISEPEANTIINTVKIGGKEGEKTIRMVLGEIKKNGVNMSEKKSVAKSEKTAKVAKEKKPKAEKKVNPDALKTKKEKLLKTIARKEKILAIIEKRPQRAQKMKEKAEKEIKVFSERLEKDKAKLKALEHHQQQVPAGDSAAGAAKSK